MCQKVLLFCPLLLLLSAWRNAGSEEGDELEKGGEGPASSGSSCFAFLFHSSPCSQA